MSAKMDGVYSRTPQQLEQKLDLGKRFAEVMGVATDARDTAEEAKKAVATLDSDLTAEEVYNRLTNNGQLQGLYRDDNGNLFVNAEYLYALEKLFAKDISMSGKFTHTAKIFLEPDQEVSKTIQNHLLGKAIIPINQFPLYDFNNDGNITLVDLAKAQKAVDGVASLANWTGAVKTDVTLTIDMSNPDKLIRIQGVNMWGRQVDKYIGVNFTNIRQERLADYVVEEGAGYSKWASGKCEHWGTFYYDATRNSVETITGSTTGSVAQFEAKYEFPFAITENSININTIRFGWMLSRPLYVAKSHTSVTITAYLNALPPEGETYDFSFDFQIKGTWK